MAEISQKSARVAKNTLLLYMRMLLMLVIGLFTSKVVLQSLGVEDFGTYTAVYEMVMLFSILSNGVGNAIARFMSYETGRSDSARQRKVFTSALTIQGIMSLGLILLAASLGLWYLNNGMKLPEGRVDEAQWVLAGTTVLAIVQLFSVPFNATIIAYEDMKAFAWISILEACLKLGAALSLMLWGSDKLLLYTALMVAAALMVRGTYAAYCRRHFPQACKGLLWDATVLRSMMSFSWWSVVGSGASALNSKGTSLLANSFFGVGINAARGIAMQVENISKQLLSNLLTAINPQITKSWASGEHGYTFHIVTKGCKFTYLLMLLIIVPVAFEADTLLQLWLGDVPAYAASFTVLALVVLAIGMMTNSLTQLMLASGKVAGYFSVESAILVASFVLSYLVYRWGYGPESCYYVQIGGYFMVSLVRLVFCHKVCGFILRPFLREAVLGPLGVTFLAAAATALPYFLMESGIARVLAVTLLSTAGTMGGSWLFAMTKGEKEFTRERLGRLFGLHNRK